MDEKNHSPEAERKDQNDSKIAEFGRSRHEGYRKFKHNFLQPAPFFFTQDHHPLPLCDLYRGRSAFLIASGPSFAAVDKTILRQPGIISLGVNNSPKVFRPNMWTCVDGPDHWIRSIWLDPTIQKFAPISFASKFIFNSDTWKEMDIRVGDCPNVVYFKRNEHFRHKQFLWEDCLNWGNHKDYGGARSVLLPAIRILFLLGFRRVYLCGVDFKMDKTSKYSFEQDRNKGSINNNNATYKALNERFNLLRPLFEEQSFYVFNTNPESELKSFDHISLADAVLEALGHMDNVNIANERTHGLYDIKIEDKRRGVGKELKK